jgi:glutamine synthetase
MGRTRFLPAAVRHLSELLDTIRSAKDAGVKTAGVTRMAKEVAELIDELEGALFALREHNAELGGDEVDSKVVHMREHVLPAMEAVRGVVDRLEKIVPDELWPVPAYRDMLFIR